MRRPPTTLIAGVLLVGAGLLLWPWRPMPHPQWSDEEVAAMGDLSLASLPPLPADATNAVADDPAAARFGQALFFDTRLSATGTVACATCHQPERGFTDGLPKAEAIGQARRNAPSIVGTAYSPWLYWDGRRDSQWAQALTPLEDPAEHGGSRTRYLRLVATDSDYRRVYESLFGALPDVSDETRFPVPASPRGDREAQQAWASMTAADRRLADLVFANLGKSIAAYERRLLHGESRFDAYVAAVEDDDRDAQRDIFSIEEAQGLRLFLGPARCTECHNGPLLTNNEFHNTGVLAFPGDLPDTGRAAGLRAVRADPFNCAGVYSDDANGYCAELEFARSGSELIGALRTPSLRNLEGTAPYMHRGQHATLNEVLEHYNEAPEAMIGHNEAKPLSLNRRELRQLEAFLRTLASPPAVDASWLEPPERSALLSAVDGIADGPH